MHRAQQWNLDIAAAVLLCAAAGMADAIGYVQSGVFAANMTGNTVLAGLSLALGEWVKAMQRAGTLATFFAGAVAGRVLLNAAGNRSTAPLLLEAVLVGLAAPLAAGGAASTAVVTFAMGMQSTALTRFHGLALSTVVMTGTMARLAEGAADRLMRRAGRAAPRHGVPWGALAWTWVAYFAGAAVAAVLLTRLALPLLLPAAVVLAVAALHARAVRQ